MECSNDRPLFGFLRVWRRNHWELCGPHKSNHPLISCRNYCCPVIQFFPRCYHRGWCPVACVVWIQPRLHLIGSNREAQAGGEEIWVTTTSRNISEPFFSPISVSPLVYGGSTFNIGIYVRHWVTALIIDKDPEDEGFVIILKYLMWKSSVRFKIVLYLKFQYDISQRKKWKCC